MKFKIGDRVKVIRTYKNWNFYCHEMDILIGRVVTIVGEWESSQGTFPTVVIKGYDRGIHGLNRVNGEYGINEACLELAIQPGEQLVFPFMKESKDV
jgi:hypothetical protein